MTTDTSRSINSIGTDHNGNLDLLIGSPQYDELLLPKQATPLHLPAAAAAAELGVHSDGSSLSSGFEDTDDTASLGSIGSSVVGHQEAQKRRRRLLQNRPPLTAKAVLLRHGHWLLFSGACVASAGGLIGVYHIKHVLPPHSPYWMAAPFAFLVLLTLFAYVITPRRRVARKRIAHRGLDSETGSDEAADEQDLLQDHAAAAAAASSNEDIAVHYVNIQEEEEEEQEQEQEQEKQQEEVAFDSLAHWGIFTMGIEFANFFLLLLAIVGLTAFVKIHSGLFISLSFFVLTHGIGFVVARIGLWFQTLFPGPFSFSMSLLLRHTVVSLLSPVLVFFARFYAQRFGVHPPGHQTIHDNGLITSFRLVVGVGFVQRWVLWRFFRSSPKRRFNLEDELDLVLISITFPLFLSVISPNILYDMMVSNPVIIASFLYRYIHARGWFHGDKLTYAYAFHHIVSVLFNNISSATLMVLLTSNLNTQATLKVNQNLGFDFIVTIVGLVATGIIAATHNHRRHVATCPDTVCGLILYREELSTGKRILYGVGGRFLYFAVIGLGFVGSSAFGYWVLLMSDGELPFPPIYLSIMMLIMNLFIPGFCMMMVAFFAFGDMNKDYTPTQLAKRPIVRVFANLNIDVWARVHNIKTKGLSMCKKYRLACPSHPFRKFVMCMGTCSLPWSVAMSILVTIYIIIFVVVIKALT